MRPLQKKQLLSVLLISSFLGTLAPLRGQDSLRYKGPLKIGAYEGEASYTYKITAGDTLLQGPFQMQRSNLEALLKKEDYSFAFAGAFEDNYPDGFWKFQFGTFQADNETQVVDYQYRVSVSGLQEEAAGLINRGRPHGPWSYSVNHIKDSEVNKTLFKSSIVFENGVPQRNFRIENDSSTLVGRFLRNGMAHDVWELYNTYELDRSERWTFNDGLLENIQTVKDGETAQLNAYTNTYPQTKTINLNTQYLDALELFLASNRSQKEVQGDMLQLLSENASYYKKIDSILSALGESDFIPEFKVRVPYFPLDSVEKRQMDSITGHFEQSKRISDSFLNNTLLNILKLSDKESSYLYHVINSISDNYLYPLQKLIDYDKREVLEFVPRNQLISSLWPNGMPSKNIVVVDSLASKTFELPNASQFTFGAPSLVSIQQLAQYASESLVSIKSILDKKLTQEQRQQELILLEERLIFQNKKLESLIDSVGNSLPASHLNALQSIKSVTDKKLSDFSTQENLDNAKLLIVCYEQMNSLAQTVAGLPGQSEEIKNLYNDRVWNPFMATLMNEEVKKRITAAYRKVLIPYFLEQIQTSLNCENVEALSDQMKSTHKRMLELREEDTSKLERKIRKEDDPKIVLELFNVTSAKKTNG